MRVQSTGTALPNSPFLNFEVHQSNLNYETLKSCTTRDPVGVIDSMPSTPFIMTPSVDVAHEISYLVPKTLVSEKQQSQKYPICIPLNPNGQKYKDKILESCFKKKNEKGEKLSEDQAIIDQNSPKIQKRNFLKKSDIRFTHISHFTQKVKENKKSKESMKVSFLSSAKVCENLANKYYSSKSKQMRDMDNIQLKVLFEMLETGDIQVQRPFVSQSLLSKMITVKELEKQLIYHPRIGRNDIEDKSRSHPYILSKRKLQSEASKRKHCCQLSQNYWLEVGRLDNCNRKGGKFPLQPKLSDCTPLEWGTYYGLKQPHRMKSRGILYPINFSYANGCWPCSAVKQNGLSTFSTLTNISSAGNLCKSSRYGRFLQPYWCHSYGMLEPKLAEHILYSKNNGRKPFYQKFHSEDRNFQLCLKWSYGNQVIPIPTVSFFFFLHQLFLAKVK